jgi:ABC-type glycerol-3-phosphate transport system substrate-binding protein
MVHKKVIVALMVVAVIAAGSALAANSRSAAVKLTLWHNYGTEANAVAAVNLAKAFEKSHPNISIKVVSQPAANYFALSRPPRSQRPALTSGSCGPGCSRSSIRSFCSI